MPLLYMIFSLEIFSQILSIESNGIQSKYVWNEEFNKAKKTIHRKINQIQTWFGHISNKSHNETFQINFQGTSFQKLQIHSQFGRLMKYYMTRRKVGWLHF